MAYSYLYPGLVLLIDLALGHGLPPSRVIPGVLVILAAMFVLQKSERYRLGSEALSSGPFSPGADRGRLCLTG